MVALNGFVKIHRKLIQWGWYKNNVIKCVFLHLLLISNFRDMPWEGIIIKKGQLVTSYQGLADDLGFSVQQVRTALKKLVSTGEITTKPTNKYTLVTVVNWEDYQLNDDIVTDTTTINQQSNNNQITNNQQQRKNDKNDKNEKNIYQLIADMYNETCISFPKLTKMSDKRCRAIMARLNSGYTENDFKTLFGKAENSAFLKGKNNRDWKATFDWLIADSNMAKVLDGNYDDKRGTAKDYSGGFD